jgi:hypothetical protein
MKLSQHIIDKHHGKMYLPYEMIKDQFIVEDWHLITGVGDVGCVGGIMGGNEIKVVGICIVIMYFLCSYDDGTCNCFAHFVATICWWFWGILAKAYIAYIAYTIFARQGFLFRIFTAYIAYTLLARLT